MQEPVENTHKFVTPVPIWDQLTPAQQEEVGDIGWPDDDTRAEIRKYSDFGDFVAAFKPDDRGITRINNFRLYFSEAGGVAADIYRTIPVFRRLKVIQPELVQSLMEKVQNNSEEDLLKDPGTMNQLFQAYGKMSGLVRVDDQDVEKHGEIQEDYLIR